jgi:uncharacterized protein YbcI
MADATKLLSEMAAVSRAMVALHKEQFGRGPTKARSDFAGRDALVCVLENVLLPAELKLVQMGHAERVREGRVSFQAATEADFVASVEQILHRKVSAFASAVDPHNDTVFEVFTFEPQGLEELGDDLDGSAPVAIGDGASGDGAEWAQRPGDGASGDAEPAPRPGDGASGDGAGPAQRAGEGASGDGAGPAQRPG